MTLTDYLDGMRRSHTIADLEAAIQARFRHGYRGRTWKTIKRVMSESGRAICDAHEHGRFVPRFGPRRMLTVCNETYKVGRGYNSTGMRYVWVYAKQFALEVLTDKGLGVRASHYVWDDCFDYPHRALKTVEEAFAGEIKDPPLNRLIFTGKSQFGPVEVDAAYERKHRAHRPCKCGGTIWDWGAGFSSGFTFVNWRCDGCTRMWTEYMTSERLTELRARAS